MEAGTAVRLVRTRDAVAALRGQGLSANRIAAALGIACGLGDWLVAGTGLVLTLAILVVLKRFETRVTGEPERH